MAKRYPISHFPNLNLPGFQNEASIEDITKGSDWQQALSLSIYSVNPDNPDQLDVLTVIRTEGTETHPHVVSTPTSRIPMRFAASLVDSRAKRRIFAPVDAMVGIRRDEFPTPDRFRLNKVDVRESRVIASYEPNIQDIPNREDELTHLAEGLLARKLGLGEALQKKKGYQPIGTVSLMDIVAGFSYAADNEEAREESERALWEPLIMYGAVMLLHDRSLLPHQTTAYRHIGWTGTKNFIGGHMRKRADILVPTIEPADEATVCVRGLCLTTTGTVTLSDQRLKAHLGL